MTSGRRVFQQHTEHAEGSDSALPPCTFRKYCTQSEKTATSPNCKQSSAAQRGRDACGTATRISASLSRRLSASFRSASDQDPKAAKYTFLIPGPGMFVNVRNAPRVVIPPPSETPLFHRVSRCVRSFSESRVCTHFCQRKQM